MKFSILAAIVFIAEFCNAAPLQNSKPTIWAENAVTAMKSSVARIYSFNQGLYNERHIFDVGSTGCFIPTPTPHSFNNNTCPNANKLAANAVLSTVTAWKEVAEAMFPVYYGLPDTAAEPRASFSDFSHWYNYLMLEIQSLQNTTSYYVCKANIGEHSDFWDAVRAAYDNNQYLVTVRFGPITGYFEPGVPNYAYNGTEWEYPYEGPFTDSIRENSVLEQDGWEDLELQLDDPTAGFPKSLCKNFGQSGLPAPRSPSTFG